MSDAPERIWAEPAGDDWDSGVWGQSKDFDHDVEYIRADLLPCWRPIAELPDKWRDGRQFFVKFADNTFGAICNTGAWESFDCYLDFMVENAPNAAPVEFLDFGGKSMPD